MVTPAFVTYEAAAVHLWARAGEFVIDSWPPPHALIMRNVVLHTPTDTYAVLTREEVRTGGQGADGPPVIGKLYHLGVYRSDGAGGLADLNPKIAMSWVAAVFPHQRASVRRVMNNKNPENMRRKWDFMLQVEDWGPMRTPTGLSTVDAGRWELGEKPV